VLLSLSTACLYHLPLRTVFRCAAEAGYEGIELVLSPQVWVRGPRHVLSLSREVGLPILSVHQPLLHIGPSGTAPQRMVVATRMALALECPCVVVHGTWARSWALPEAQRWLRILDDCQERLVGSETRLALENHGLYGAEDGATVLDQLSEFEGFCRQRDLDITFDTCHAGSYTMGLLAAYGAVRERLANVHLSDLKRSPGGSPAPRWRSFFTHHRMPGEGDLPLAELLAQLASDGYCGPVSVEISPWSLQAWSLRRARARLAQAAEYVRAAAGRRQAAPKVSGPRPDRI